MKDRDKIALKDQSSLDELDITNIDQSIFDDPVLLLEYLEKQEAKNKTTETKQASMRTINHQKTPVTKHHSSIQYSEKRPVVPYGYSWSRGKYQINPEQAEAIAEIFSLHNEGYSYSQIEYLLRRTTYRTVTGKKFYLSAIYNIIKDQSLYEGKTGYPPILKPVLTSALRQKQTASNNSSASDKQASTYDDSSPYWEAVNKLRNNIETRKVLEVQKQQELEKKVFHSVDDFLDFIKTKGVPIKDNRWNDGCLWVRADVEIADLMAHVVIKSRGFKYAPKCRAFNGEPGWYY